MEVNSFLDFLSNNSLALFTLAGVLLGSFSSFITAIIMSRREVRLKLREKILDRRIQAHELVINLSHSMRTMRVLGGHDEEGELARTPALLFSKDEFDEWFHYFYQTLSSTSNWLGENITHELNLLQDYLVNLNEFLGNVPPDNYKYAGQIIRQDFIEFSESVEKLAYKFFKEDLEKLRITPLPDWHKYPIEETKRRLNNTNLLKRRDDLGLLTNGD